MNATGKAPLDEHAAILEACLKSTPIILTVYLQRNCYNVRDSLNRAIWADDLPGGGYKGLLKSFSLLIDPAERKNFIEALSIPKASAMNCNFRETATAFMTGSKCLHIELELQAKSIVVLHICNL